jgi:hypothetical protein
LRSMAATSKGGRARVRAGAHPARALAQRDRIHAVRVPFHLRETFEPLQTSLRARTTRAAQPRGVYPHASRAAPSARSGPQLEEEPDRAGGVALLTLAVLVHVAQAPAYNGASRGHGAGASAGGGSDGGSGRGGGQGRARALSVVASYAHDLRTHNGRGKHLSSANSSTRPPRPTGVAQRAARGCGSSWTSDSQPSRAGVDTSFPAASHSFQEQSQDAETCVRRSTHRSV